jgi:hypothetical protein
MGEERPDGCKYGADAVERPEGGESGTKTRKA